MLTKQKQIQHLYWRAGFGLTNEDLSQKINQPLHEIIDDLFKESSEKAPLYVNLDKMPLMEGLSDAAKAKIRKKGRRDTKNVNAAWVKRMTSSKNPLLERMTLFWHGHFACVIRNNPYVSLNQNNTIRENALGNFKDLVLAIAKDPGMIRFLNNQQNKKDKINENFARELLELFTIGRGHYTEKDIKEAARAFTGWQSYKTVEFFFNRKRHDFGEKTFFGKTGEFNGDDIIDIILENKQTARFVSTKVYRYFVNSKVNENHVEELTNAFYDSNYDIEILMRTVFESDWFYHETNIGSKIKSPIDLLVGMMKTLSVKFTDEDAIFFIERVLGQILFDPPNVAGWPGGQAWIDNATLMLRLNLGNYLFQASNLAEITNNRKFTPIKSKSTLKRLNAKIDIDSIIHEYEDRKRFVIFRDLKNWIIQPKLTIEKVNFDDFTINRSPNEYIQSIILRLMTLPEYQMC